MFRNFYNSLNLMVFIGPETLPRTWNNGMLEDWNIDLKGIISSNPFVFKREI